MPASRAVVGRWRPSGWMRVALGPFVTNSLGEIEQVYADLRVGRLGAPAVNTNCAS